MVETLAEAANRVQVESPNSRGSEFDREFSGIGSRSGVAERPIRAALSVRCGKLLEFRGAQGQGIFCHPRSEFFRPRQGIRRSDREIGASLSVDQ
jgi:hypothetical protein